MTKQDPFDSALLSSGDDPEAVEIVNPDSDFPLLLVCEHAGQSIPQALDNMGLSKYERSLHIAYDIGAEHLARGLAERFGCRLILQRYSRLVIDCNRKPGTPASIPEVSDSILIPGNQNLLPQARQLREKEVFQPFADQCLSETSRPQITFTFSIHSFTRQMQDGAPRPWDICFLYRAQTSKGEKLAGLCQQMFPDLTVGNNEPYFIDEITDWFIPVCAEPRQIPHSLIEVRNDHLRTSEQIEEWVERLYHLMTTFMEQTNDPHP